MPRPGPRPYECIRRAWHSDRHQPMRGLFIQEIFRYPSLFSEIFRIVNEIHSPATKKNKEWQEKLPVVVLKAEEIMYSKANSEAEYVDLRTLLDRTNDAINTIIRLDETTETGEFLQPCIEAALHLGCTPRRASRSQRNISPRCYLNQEPNSLEAVSQNHIFMKPPGTPFRNPTNLIPQANNFAPKNFPFTFENDVLRSSRDNQFEKHLASKYSAYPLCYSFRVPSTPISNFVFNSSKSNSQFKNSNNTGNRDMQDDTNFGECDLSLRLGPLEDIRSPTRKRSKTSDPTPAFCNSGLSWPVSSFSGQWVTKDEILKVNAAMAAEKNESLGQVMDERRFSWRSELSYGQL